ncbi:MAG TPA: hypothetical protein VFL94_02315 [Actinomycetales bacterium]|nr:hypothetical protein [Actinomycetales bacterium]
MAVDTSVATTAVPSGTGLAVRLSMTLSVVAAVAAFLTFAVDGILVGPAVMNGSARGTALVMLVVGVPVLVVAARLAHRGSDRARFVWAGMAMYLTYNAFMLLAGTPINRLFLLYVATLGLAVATTAAIARSSDVDVIVQRIDPTLPARRIAGYLGAIVVLNALAWLARVVPATVDDRMSDLVDGMGLATVPTYLQDLSFWLPLLGFGSWLLWHRRVWGYAIGGAGLAFWALEAVTVAVDQWFGHRADPTSAVASDAVVIPFAILAVVGTAVLWSFLRHVDVQPDADAA